MISPTLQKIDEFTRQQLKDLLAQCTQQEQDRFYLMYPEGIDKMDAKKIPWAIQQCEATLAKKRV